MRLINVLHSKQFIFISPQIVSSQKFLCSKVNLQLLFEHKSHENKILGPPLQKHSIQEDGNCLFRALSYIVTGRQTDHHILRSKVIEHIKTIEVYLLPHMKCSLENYLQKSQMRSSGTWGTDIENFFSCILAKHRYICIHHLVKVLTINTYKERRKIVIKYT